MRTFLNEREYRGEWVMVANSNSNSINFPPHHHQHLIDDSSRAREWNSQRSAQAVSRTTQFRIVICLVISIPSSKSRMNLRKMRETAGLHESTQTTRSARFNLIKLKDFFSFSLCCFVVVVFNLHNWKVSFSASFSVSYISFYDMRELYEKRHASRFQLILHKIRFFETTIYQKTFNFSIELVRQLEWVWASCAAEEEKESREYRHKTKCRGRRRVSISRHGIKSWIGHTTRSEGERERERNSKKEEKH